MISSSFLQLRQVFASATKGRLPKCSCAQSLRLIVPPPLMCSFSLIRLAASFPRVMRNFARLFHVVQKHKMLSKLADATTTHRANISEGSLKAAALLFIFLFNDARFVPMKKPHRSLSLLRVAAFAVREISSSTFCKEKELFQSGIVPTVVDAAEAPLHLLLPTYILRHLQRRCKTVLPIRRVG